MGSLESLNEVFQRHWAALGCPPAGTHTIQSINGYDLSIATVVLVAR